MKNVFLFIIMFKDNYNDNDNVILIIYIIFYYRRRINYIQVIVNFIMSVLKNIYDIKNPIKLHVQYKLYNTILIIIIMKGKN